MSKIIVGVDESDRSRDAVALAAMLARGSDAELVLVCAYPYDDVPGRGAHTGYRQYLREDAEAAIESCDRRHGRAAAYAEAPIAELSPAKAIQNVAAQGGRVADRDRLQRPRRRRPRVRRHDRGAPAARRALPGRRGPPRLPTLEPGDIGTIVVGYDGSVEAKAALVGARTIARVRGARLRLVEVLDATWMGTPALMQGPGYILTPDDAEARARDYLTKTASTLAADVPTEPVVAVGAPEQVLADESKSADLVVVGSRGYGPHRAVLLGSVSGRLMRESASPVLVVPRGIEAPLEELFSPATETQHA